jgi:2-methylcitrate dehydratase PrpD
MTESVAIEESAVGTAEGATQALGTFASDLTFADLPDAVVHKAKLLLRDGLGNQLGASTMAEPARIALEAVSEFGGTGQATVTGYGNRMPVPFAAMLNAMLGHGIELDDAHGSALTKSGSLLVPTVMTTGEFLARSGRDTLTALVVGYDVIVRVAMAINPSHRTRGFHTTGAVGAVASAAAAGKQYGFDADRLADVIGLGTMQAAGIQAYLDYPCMAKPFSPGKAAFNGTLAAALVQKGFTGPRYGLESREGFFNAYADEVDTNWIFDGLGEQFKVMEVGFKPHAACRYAHGPIDAAQEIRQQADLSTDDIADITVHMCELAIRQSGRTVAPNINAAMGSTPFGVALALTRGQNGLADYEIGFEDKQVHDLAGMVKLIAEPSYGLMGRQAVVEVNLKSGANRRVSVAGPKGEPDLPMSDQELETKFLGLAELAVGEKAARQINEMVLQIEEIDDLSKLVTLLVRA